MAEEDVVCLLSQFFSHLPCVKTHADRARITRLALGDPGTERLEPLERLVQARDDHRLQVGVAARALGPELLDRAVAPDDAAREEHRPARAVALLQHHRFRTELARPRGGDQAGHACSGDREVGYLSANVGFCSTYSIFTPSGPQMKIA